MKHTPHWMSAPRRGPMTLLAILACAWPFLLNSCGDSDGTGTPPHEDPLLFINSHFRGAHNSYSGNGSSGHRGTIRQQLDAGLRFVEFDIRYRDDVDWPEDVGFVVGHDSAGDEVDHSRDNPDSDDLREWINIVADWCFANSPREPIILALDWKPGFDDEATPKALKALNDDLVATTTPPFGHLSEMILFPKDLSPSTDRWFDLAGRILVVLSGDHGSRKYYATNYCFSEPCLDADKVAHMFVEHQMGDGDLGEELFYAAEADGHCGWVKQNPTKVTRLWEVTNDDCSNPAPNLPATNAPYFGWYARYATEIHTLPGLDYGTVTWHGYTNPWKGSNPDVAVNNSGYVVEVHKSQNTDELYYATGELTAGGDIEWKAKNVHMGTTGENPSVALTDKNVVVSIHGSENNSGLFYNYGTFDPEGERWTISWVESVHYDEGEHPWVGMNEDNVVVEVHESPSGGQLWYNVGQYTPGDQTNPASLRWGPMADYRNYDSGYRPTVAVYGNQVFEAHNSIPGPFEESSLWCSIIRLDPNEPRLYWDLGDEPPTNTYQYPIDQPGSLYPSVALNATGAVEVHKAGNNIWWRTGRISNTIMAVGETLKLQDLDISPPEAHGTQVSIDANEDHVVLAYVGTHNNIYIMVGDLN